MYLYQYQLQLKLLMGVFFRRLPDWCHRRRKLSMDLKVDVRFARIAAIPTLGNYLASADSISFLYAWTVREKVCSHAVFMFAVANNDMVSSHI